MPRHASTMSHEEYLEAREALIRAVNTGQRKADQHRELAKVAAKHTPPALRLTVSGGSSATLHPGHQIELHHARSQPRS